MAAILQPKTKMTREEVLAMLATKSSDYREGFILGMTWANEVYTGGILGGLNAD